MALEGFVDRETVAQAAANAAPVSLAAQSEKELFVRHAREDGESRSQCFAPSTTETPASSRPRSTPPAPIPRDYPPRAYTFANAVQATQFVTEAVEALMVLGCDVQAQ